MTMPNESILSTGFHLYILPSWGRDPSDVYLMRVQLSINRMNHYKHGADHCLPSNDSLKKKKSSGECSRNPTAQKTWFHQWHFMGLLLKTGTPLLLVKTCIFTSR